MLVQVPPTRRSSRPFLLDTLCKLGVLQNAIWSSLASWQLRGNHQRVIEHGESGMAFQSQNMSPGGHGINPMDIKFRDFEY
jgi:hypothetical protein